MNILPLVLATGLLIAVASAPAAPPEIGTANPKNLGGFEADFTPGRTPTQEQIRELEKQVAAHPDDFKLVRKLGIGYFYRVFGDDELAAAPKAQKTLRRALELKPDDGLTIAFQGALAVVAGNHLPDLKGRADALFKRALALEPDNVGILSLAVAVSSDAKKIIELTERIRKVMGPEFKNWSRHGLERILLAQGRAYVKVGRHAEARACFEEGLAINPHAFQAELDKLKK